MAFFDSVCAPMQLLRYTTKWRYITCFYHNNEVYSQWGLDHLHTLWLHNVTMTYFLCRTTVRLFGFFYSAIYL